MPTAPRFSLKQLSGICRRVGTSIEAGVDARKAWRRESERVHGRRAQAIAAIVDELDRGTSTPDALQQTGDAFPPLMHDLVVIGEHTGKLDQVFLRLADHFDHLQELRRSFLTGITWPAIQLLMAVFVVGLLILVMGIIPADINGRRMDLLGLGLMGPKGLIEYVVYIVSFLVLAGFLIENWRRGRLGGDSILSFLYRLPVLGQCLQTLSLGRMAWTMALTLDTPMDVKSAMRSSLRSTGAPIYTRHAKAIVNDLKGGSTIYKALRNTREFPDEFLDVVQVGEETGQVSESLLLLSKQYQERAKAAAKTLTVVGSFAVWGLVACLIISIIFRLAMSYTGMIQEMSDPNWINKH